MKCIFKSANMLSNTVCIHYKHYKYTFFEITKKKKKTYLV